MRSCRGRAELFELDRQVLFGGGRGDLAKKLQLSNACECRPSAKRPRQCTLPTFHIRQLKSRTWSTSQETPPERGGGRGGPGAPSADGALLQRIVHLGSIPISVAFVGDWPLWGRPSETVPGRTLVRPDVAEVYGESDSRGPVEVARPSEVCRDGLHASLDYHTEG